MGLDGGTGALEGDTLNHIRVESSLQQEVHGTARLLHNPLCLTLEDLNEGVSNDLALPLRIINSLQLPQELLTGIYNSQVDAKMLGQRLVDDLALIQSHHTVIDEDSVETVANGFVHQLGSDCRIDTSRHGADNLAGRSNDVPDTLNLSVDEPVHGPVLVRFAEFDSKIGEELLALRGVRDFRVELDTVHRSLGVRNTGKGSVGGSRNRQKLRRELSELVAVRHPYGEFSVQAGEEDINMGRRVGVTGDREDGVSVLLAVARRDVLSVVPGNLLETVANSENGNLCRKIRFCS